MHASFQIIIQRAPHILSIRLFNRNKWVNNCIVFFLKIRVGVNDFASLRSISLGDTLRPLYFISRSECEENKTSQKSHFVTTAEICMHPIECYSGHISVPGFGINDLLVFPLLHAIHHFDRFLYQGWATFPRFHHFINTAEWKFKWTKHNQCIARSHDGIIIMKNVLLLSFWVLTIFRIWDISVLE